MSFVNLHLHSEYSLCDSLLRIEDLTQQIAQDGAEAVALTDVGNLFGVVKFYNAAIKNGVKPIIGCELKMRLDEHADIVNVNISRRGEESFCSIIALCMNNTGYLNLTQLVTRSYLEGQTLEGALVQREWFKEYGEGLILLSGGARGDVGCHLLAGEQAKAHEALQFWRSAFPDRYYLEVYLTEREGEINYFHQILPIATREQLPLVITNDVCFPKEDDFDAHEVRVCIAQGGFTLNDSRRRSHHSRQQYLKSHAQMCKLFPQIPQALQNTEEIAKRCTVTLEQGGISLPDFKIPQGMTKEQYLTKKANEGLKQRFGEKVLATKQIYAQRLKEELEIILRMNYAGYFLIVADFIHWAKQQHIPVGPGRGSGAGSLTAYALGITELNPIKYDLLFERFLNPERVSPPDFDVDFCMENRDRVIEYVAERYGRDKVCQIITFGRLSARLVVRDVGRVLGHPYGYVDQIAKLIPDDLNITLGDALSKSPELKLQYQSDEKTKEIFDIAGRLEGLVRDPSTHAGGVIISPKPLIEYTALYKKYKETTTVTQLDMKDIEAVGLVKFDFLGLKTLTMLQLMISILKDCMDKEILLEEILLDDPKVYSFLQTGKTKAVFQLESEGMRSLIKELKPNCFEDIIALLALYRPGPLNSGMVKDYINRKHGAKVEYLHPALKAILHSTYGVILYQEQVMQIARELSAYTLGAADILRRAMGKKLPEEMAKQKSDFVNGAVERGVEQSVAIHIFSLIEHFAGYGFNKAHSAAYALLAYQTAWFKTHYPAACMAAALTVDMGNTDKLVDLIYECRAMNLEIKPPEINISQSGFMVLDDKTILYGLSAIRSVGKGVVEAMINERDTNGQYKSLMDFCTRAIQHKIRKNTVEAMVRSGAFDSFGQSRSEMLQSLGSIYKRSEVEIRDHLAGQDSLFDSVNETSEDEKMSEITMQQYEEWSHEYLLQLEKETLGFYLSEHPINRYEKELEKIVGRRLIDETKIQASQEIHNQAQIYRFAGVIDNVKRRGQRGHGALFTLDDGNHRVMFSIYDEDYRACEHLLSHKDVVIIEGRKKMDRMRKISRWYAKRISTLDEARLRFVKSFSLTLDLQESSNDLLDQLKVLLEPFVIDGRCPVRVRLKTKDAYTELVLGENWRVKPCGALFHQVESLKSIHDVRFTY